MHTTTCKNCGNHFQGKFCNECGEKVYGPKDKSLWHIFEEFFHFLSHFEGKFLLTLRTIFTRPGKFSQEYCEGVRIKYFKPVSFFMLIVILYLIFPFANGLNLSLGNHVQSWYGGYARKTALQYMQVHHINEEVLVAKYTAASEKVSKLLLFLLIPVMAFFCVLYNRKRKKPFFDHLIFSTETTSVFVLWGFLVIPLILRLCGMLLKNMPQETDPYTVPVIMAIVLLYTFIAARRFYGFSKWGAGIFSLLFITILPLFAHYVYSFILFFTTIHLLH